MGARLRISSQICVCKMPGTSGVLGTPRGTEGGPAPSGAVWVGRVGRGRGTGVWRCRHRNSEGSARGGQGRGSWEKKVTPQERRQRESEERGEVSWG